MTHLPTFVRDARAKGLSDEQIQKALSAEGWDDTAIAVALSGLTVPTPDKPTAKRSQQKHVSLNPLLAALHHILLWFFVAASTTTIISVVASLSGYDVSSTALASMIAVTVVTFTPYAILFLLYLKKSWHIPELVPGWTWSIITICFHSVAAMVAAITLVVNLITEGEINTTISSVLVLALDGIVITTYSFATFSSQRLFKAKRIILIAYIPLLLALFGSLFTMSVLQFGPARHDEALRTSLTKTVNSVVEYTRNANKLPSDGNKDILADQSITYENLGDTTYQVCATFQTSSRQQAEYNDTYSSSNDDSYVYESQFSTGNTGYSCFEFQSSYLTQEQERNAL